MENKNFQDEIYERELTFYEILKKSLQVMGALKQPILISFFLFFIPALVILSIVFRNDLSADFSNLAEMEMSVILFYLCQMLMQQTFFSAVIFFVVRFYEKKIIQTSLFMSFIFSRFFFFLFTFGLQFSLILAGFMLFFVPGLIVAIFLCFSSLLVFSENLWGFDAFRESIRTVKASWFKVLVFFIILNLFDLFVPVGINYFLKNILYFRVELKFFTEQLLFCLISLFPAFLFAVFFYNVRQKIEPKDKAEEPTAD